MYFKLSEYSDFCSTTAFPVSGSILRHTLETCSQYQSFLILLLSFCRCPFCSSQCGLGCQPDVCADRVAPAARHGPPWRPFIQRLVSQMPQQWATGMSAMWRQRGVCSRQAGVKGNTSGDQQAAGPHVVHLRHPGLSPEREALKLYLHFIVFSMLVFTLVWAFDSRHLRTLKVSLKSFFLFI